VEPPQAAARSTTVHKDVPFISIYKMYHIPERAHQDYPTADLLTDILSNGKAGHLFQRMVKDKQIASSIRAFSWGAFDPGMISIDGSVAQGKSIEAYEDALDEVIDDLLRIPEEELQRVKNAIESQYIMERTTLLNKAMLLAMSDAIGDVELANNTIDRYMATTTHDIVEGTRRFLVPQNCSTLYYLPLHAKHTA
jgi:predicted Zn-dependent peptidase